MDGTVDVFIPLHPKDLAVAPACIASLRRHLVPQAGRIIVIPAGEWPGCVEPLRRHGVEILPESAFTAICPKRDLPRIEVRGKYRTGWYFQQFIKYEARRFATGGRYVVMDADTVLVAPLILWREGRPVFDASGQHHVPYFDCFERLLGWRPDPAPSFIVNYMLFEVDEVERLVQAIEARHPGRTWDRTVMALVDPAEMSGFSEFETYGHVVARHRAGGILRGEGRNRELRVRQRWLHAWHRRRAIAAGCNSVSYHNHRRPPPPPVA